MTNPAPRPALRKAPDANVHPALAFAPSETIDLRSDRRADSTASAARHDSTAGSLVPASKILAVDDGGTPAKAGSKKHRAKAKKSKAEVDAKPGTKKRAKAAPLAKSQLARVKSTKLKKEGKKEGKSGQLARGSAAAVKRGRVDVRLQVPGDVRRQLRSAAKARGTSVEDVVTSVLEGWRPS